MPRDKRSKNSPKKPVADDPRLAFVKTIQWHHTIRTLISWLAAIGLVYVGVALPIKYSAGEDTSITFVVRMILSSRVSTWLPTLVAVASFGLWQWERVLRKRTVRREHSRVEEFEKQMDPNRTSSDFEE